MHAMATYTCSYSYYTLLHDYHTRILKFRAVVLLPENVNFL